MINLLPMESISFAKLFKSTPEPIFIEAMKNVQHHECWRKFKTHNTSENVEFNHSQSIPVTQEALSDLHDAIKELTIVEL